MIIEEKFMKEADLHPLFFIGWEGVFGMLLSFGISLPVVSSIPGSDCGKYENVLDGMVMLGQSSLLLSLFLTYYVSCAIHQGVAITVCSLSLYPHISAFFKSTSHFSHVGFQSSHCCTSHTDWFLSYGWCLAHHDNYLLRYRSSIRWRLGSPFVHSACRILPPSLRNSDLLSRNPLRSFVWCYIYQWYGIRSRVRHNWFNTHQSWTVNFNIHTVLSEWAYGRIPEPSFYAEVSSCSMHVYVV